MYKQSCLFSSVWLFVTCAYIEEGMKQPKTISFHKCWVINHKQEKLYTERNNKINRIFRTPSDPWNKHPFMQHEGWVKTSGSPNNLLPSLSPLSQWRTSWRFRLCTALLIDWDDKLNAAKFFFHSLSFLTGLFEINGLFKI